MNKNNLKSRKKLRYILLTLIILAITVAVSAILYSFYSQYNFILNNSKTLSETSISDSNASHDNELISNAEKYINKESLAILSDSDKEKNISELNDGWMKEDFSSKDNSNEKINEQIIDSTENSDSFKHIETNYQCITNDKIIEKANQILSNRGYDLTINNGDVCAITKFTTEENGTAVSQTAVSILSANDGEIKAFYIFE